MRYLKHGSYAVEMKSNQIEKGKALLLFGVIVASIGDVCWYIGLFLGLVGLIMGLLSKGV